jgi:hypothetical protein
MLNKLERNNPIITSYPDIANLMSLISGDKYYRSWISMNFYQLAFRINCSLGFGTFLDSIRVGNDITIFEKCPYLYCNIADKEIIKNSFNSFFEFIMFIINKKYYIYLDLNVRYIKIWNADKDFMHETFISGYDSIKQEIYISDFFNGSYRNVICNKEEIEDSFYNSFKDNIYYQSDMYKMGVASRYEPNKVLLISLNNKRKIEIDKDLIKLKIKDYLNSTDTLCNIRESYVQHNLEYAYGSSFYDYLIKEIESNVLDIRKGHVLYDHKKMLTFNLDTLYNHSFITSNDYIDLKEELIRLEEISLLLRNKLIKLKILLKRNNSLNEKEKNDIVLKYKLLKKNDICLFEKLLHAL